MTTSVRPIGPAWQPQPQPRQERSPQHEAAADATAAGAARGVPAAAPAATSPVILAPLRGMQAAAPFLAQVIDQEMLGGGKGAPVGTSPTAAVRVIDGGSGRAHKAYSAAAGTRPPAGLAADIET